MKLRRQIPILMTGHRTRNLFNVIGILGFCHLLVQIFFRIYIYFNPFSAFYSVVGLFGSSCYSWERNNIGMRSGELETLLDKAEYEFEQKQILYSSNEVYSADASPARSFFSFERALLQPLITSALEHHDLSKLTTEVTNIIAEPFTGFGNLFHLMVESPGGLHKLSVFLPASEPRHLPKIGVSKTQHVKVIVPYFKEVSRLKAFLQMMRVLMNLDRHFSVVLVDFVNEECEKVKEQQLVKKLISEALVNSELISRITVIPIVGPFSRGLGLNQGAKFAGKDCTLFFCDIDLTFNHQTLNKCRLLAIKETSVYFPIVFSQFNPDLSKIHMTKMSLLINKQSGFWRDFGFGMSCIHVHDFKDSIKFPEYKTWGREDDMFHSAVKNSGLTVYRLPDPTLIHAYHSKNCSRATDKVACFKTQAAVEGNSIQLGVELFKLRDKIVQSPHQ